MKCESVIAQLDDYLDNELSAQEHEAIVQHLQQCESCQTEFQATQNLLEELGKLDVPAPRPGYEERVLRFLHEDRPQQKQRHTPRSMPVWFATGFVTAALAIFAVLFISNSPILEPDAPMPVMTVELQPLQTRNVDLVFSSPREIHNASLRIELPEGTEIAGYPNQQSLEWKTNLKSGTNRLSLPLIIKHKSGGKLFARISHGGQTRTFELNVIALPASSHYPGTLAS
ncbi:MAG: zf-HC2 domain-containing protein [Thioalkalispiraceae bacterium]|jgi:hypothetical protein